MMASRAEWKAFSSGLIWARRERYEANGHQQAEALTTGATDMMVATTRKRKFLQYYLTLTYLSSRNS